MRFVLLQLHDDPLQPRCLHLTAKTSKWQQRNNCAASMNKEQPGKLEPETYAVRFAQEQGGRRLCLTSSKGSEVCYRAE